MDRKGRRSPEKERAAMVLRQSLREQRRLMTYCIPDQLLRTGYRAFSAVPIEKRALPREPAWSWRQSSGTLVERLDGGIQASIVKLSSRRSKKGTGPPVPSYKVWLAELSQNGVPCMWFLWVERGVPRTVASAYDLLAAESFLLPEAEPLPTLFVKPFNKLGPLQSDVPLVYPTATASAPAAATVQISEAHLKNTLTVPPEEACLPQLSEVDFNFLGCFL